MVLTLPELEARLAALEGLMAQLRLEYPAHDDLLEAVAAVADGIHSEAGDHADYVSARVLTILLDNGLGPIQGQ